MATRIISFLRGKKGTIVLVGLIIMFVNLALFLYDVNSEIFIYINSLMAFFIIPYFYISYRHYYKHLREVELYGDKYLYEKMASEDLIEAKYLSIIEELKEALREKEDKDKRHYQEILDYYTIWVHQIKTPIAAMRMLIDGSNYNPQINIELLKIEDYVDMVLSYLKLEEGANDFLFNEVNLDTVITDNIKQYAPLFIHKKIKVDYKKTELIIISDSKWLSFIIGQILSNALKYTKSGGTISIVVEDHDLVITDTGIGIKEEDLPLLFNKGYSGTVGREYKKATGLGLYLVKRFCDILDITPTISSKVAEGTVVRLTLPKRKPFFDGDKIVRIDH